MRREYKITSQSMKGNNKFLVKDSRIFSAFFFSASFIEIHLEMNNEVVLKEPFFPENGQFL